MADAKSDCSTTERKAALSLLTLPAEIRNQIWSLLLENQHIHIRRAQCHPTPPYFYHHVLPRDHCPLIAGEIKHRSGPVSLYDIITPIWLVNRALYEETRLMPFLPSNVFSFEDEYVLVEFLAQSTPEQVSGITHLWIKDDHQSGAAMEAFATFLGESETVSDRFRRMTVYIPSRCNKLEMASNCHRVGAMHITERLRAGWELSNERQQVDGLKEMWEKLSGRAIIVEL